MRPVSTTFSAAALLLAGCEQSSASSDQSPLIEAVDENLMTDMNVASGTESEAGAPKPPQPPPLHNYDFREGFTYGYVAAISEEQQKQGKAAGDVLTFAYKGFSAGADHLERIDPDGKVFGVSECARPCRAIKTTYPDGDVRRVAYNPESIIGAAFQDAARGMLVASPTKREPQPSPPPPESVDAQTEMPEPVSNPTANNVELNSTAEYRWD